MIRPGGRARGTLRATLVLVVLAVACTPEKREKRMESEQGIALQSHAFGRFQIGAPVTSTREGTNATFGWMTAEEVRLVGRPEEAFDHAWATKLEEIASLATDRRYPGDLRGTIHKAELVIPRQLATVSYMATGNKEGVTVATVRDGGGIALWLSKDFSVKFEPEIRQKSLAIAGAYRLRAENETWPAPGKDWFYLQHGAIAFPFQEQESVTVVFRGGPLEGDLVVETATAKKIERKGLLTKFMDALGVAGNYAAGVSPVRNRSRKVGPFKGEELILRSDEQEEVAFLWEFEGEENSAHAPKIKIAWQTSEVNEKAKVALWDQILDSLKLAQSP